MLLEAVTYGSGDSATTHTGKGQAFVYAVVGKLTSTAQTLTTEHLTQYVPVSMTTNESCYDCQAEEDFWLVYPPIWSVFILVSTLIVIILTTMGNVLVIVAFSREKKLRSFSNFYILNLSMADLLIGSFAIPMCVPYVLLGKWVMGPALCKLWVMIDYTLCTSSLFSVVLITFDRYLSVTRAIKYRTQTTIKGTVMKMSLAWIIPLLFYGTTVIGWEYYTGITVPGDQCYAAFADNFPLTFAQTVLEFFLPLILIFYFNISIFVNIRKRTKRSIKKVPMPAFSFNASIKISNESESSQIIGRNSSLTHQDSKVKLYIESEKDDIISCGEIDNEDHANINSDEKEQHTALLPRQTLQVPGKYEEIQMNSLNKTPDGQTPSTLLPNNNKEYRSCLSPKCKIKNGGEAVRRPSALSVTITEPELNNTGTTATAGALSTPEHKADGESRVHMAKLSASSHQAVRRKLSRDKKLAKSLIIIVGAFVLCWTPYQILNLVQSLCGGDCINTTLYDFSFWILWLNSTLNPLLYPFCNNQFKMAFKKILCRRKFKRNRQAYTLRECHSTTITVPNRFGRNYSETTSGIINYS
ncbi:histamine H3 receptor-like [Saccoglossus kowalevskii]